MTPRPETDPIAAADGPAAVPAPAAAVAAGVALAYAVFGALALALAGSPAYAAPLYPPAGIALAAVLVYGNAGLGGALVGAFAVSAGLGVLRGQSGLLSLLLPLVLAAGAALQAGIGAALVRRWVSQPLVLDAPRDIALTGLLGGAVACVVSPSVATLALLAFGIVGSESAAATWGTWWVGDTMGVLIGTPLMLTVVGRPRADWAPRRRTLALPLLLAMALLGGGMVELTRVERQRLQATFERDADRLASEAQARLALPLHALQALHSSARANGVLDGDALRQAARWWLAQSDQLQAMGYSERVPLAALPAYEAAAQAQGAPGLRVFDRDGGAARRADGEVLVLRHVEPEAANAGAVGVNTLSIPAARAAVLATQASGEPAATAGFRLTQSQGDETGVVLYQALFRRDADAPSLPLDAARRRAAMRGVVFVSLRTEQAMVGLAQEGAGYLRWCLVDTAPGVERTLLAGRRDCGQPDRDPAAVLLSTVKPLQLADRALELRIDAPAAGVPGYQREAAWLLAASGLAATAMLCALLLTVTGHSRRTEVAVQAGTAELRREIAERRLAEAALRESELRLRSILDHVPIGVMFLDLQGRILEANPRLCEMLGRTAEQLRGAAVDELVHPDEAPRMRSLQAELLARGGDGVVDRLRLQAGGGRAELMVRITASALHRAGAVGRIVAVVEDITAALRLQASESALHRAEAANRAKTEFVSRMSHELRTPLNAMIGFTQLLDLDRDRPLADQQREWTQQVLRAGWHLLEMINETLDLARIESGAVQLSVSPVALPALAAACRAMVATAAAQRGIAVRESLDPDAGAVLADATRLKQVLTNLLSNAVKYNREGGAVTLTTRRVRAAAGDEGGAPAGWVEIAVADDGLGMTPEQVAALFEPYNRLGRESSGIEGTGIGLVISRRLTELMGGTIEVASEAGKGSIFTARLPAAAAAELPPSQYTDTSPAPYQERLVHYVEDNETNVEVMRGVLAQRPQIRLEISQLGLDGLAAIRRTLPDLILLDMNLPDISGLELLRHLKRDEVIAAIPVVVVSADATASNRKEALTSGAAHYVTKPLDMGRFLQLVDEILERADTRFG